LGPSIFLYFWIKCWERWWEKRLPLSHEFGFVVSCWWGINDGELGWCGGWASFFFFFLVTVGVQVSLRALRLISRCPKVNDQVSLQWPWDLWHSN
jgi:hypothetical protein